MQKRVQDSMKKSAGAGFKWVLNYRRSIEEAEAQGGGEEWRGEKRSEWLTVSWKKEREEERRCQT